MGGDRSQLANKDDSSGSLFLCEASSGTVVRADCWKSVDTGMPESSVSQELTDKILAFESMEKEGLIERIQLQTKALQENSEQNLEDVREIIKGYRPGDGIRSVGGICRSGFAIPEATTLLVVGFAGAGKSCLINNMIRVVDNVTDGFDRAQTYVDMANGSLFLQEYFLSGSAQNFCVFDSRGFSTTNAFEDLDIIKKWISNGICHGEAVCRPSDTKTIREALEGRGRQGHSDCTVRRVVDFVIFVVDAFTVHRMRESHDVAALGNLAMLYKSPFLSFKDDVPVVVMTHGDKLAPQDRVLTRIFIGELLGVSPIDHIFDISCFTERSMHPGDVDTYNDLVLVNMLKFSLERADKNLPYKARAALLPSKICGAMGESWNKLGSQRLLMIVMLLWLVYAIFIMVVYDWKSNGGFRSLGDKIFQKMQKKLRHAHRHQYRL
ncbi:hypothetical protein GOP47_0007099 [Adiantum capillus-veneris]|uniref:Uncharacterized protein n=1 Tax=Adiantum capillus-veneris TaxID=13818 RepID=A0A9D4ZLK3_ADICA|nr:hypothetical protein GOP47_0007099 [Adiantum capillus-veneris]